VCSARLAAAGPPTQSASKWALGGLSRSAAYVYADWGIRSNVIQPGWIETDLTAAMSNPLMKRMQSGMLKNTVLLRRSGKGEDIAGPALFVASDESSYITGTEIIVGGGWFSCAPYLTNERRHHGLSLLERRDRFQKFLGRFR
jgi:NAD(P)-dependent dehydrogenase (short-subunit alcohol dehydrogenase family)